MADQMPRVFGDILLPRPLCLNLLASHIFNTAKNIDLHDAINRDADGQDAALIDQKFIENRPTIIFLQGRVSALWRAIRSQR